MKSLLIYIVFCSLVVHCSGKSARILGGVDAKEGEAPHMVALLNNGSFVCGGSIVGSAQKHVLTAAHCVYEHENSPFKFTVQYGSLKLYNGTEVKVTEISRHPQYSSTIPDYDLAILHLSEAIIKGPNAAAIELATSTPLTGSNVTVTGFGFKSWNDSSVPAEHLQIAQQLPVMNHDQCEYDWSGVNTPITDRIICVISEKQTLPGDSGGPMVFEGKLVGVTSFGKMKVDGSLMNGYMNVPVVKSWIESQINGTSGNKATTCFINQSLSNLCAIFLVFWIVKNL